MTNESYGPNAVVSELGRLIEVHKTYRAVADEIGVNHGVVWMALRPPMDRYVSACLYDALGIRKGNRTRLTADVTPEEKAVIMGQVKWLGHDSFTDYCRDWARKLEVE